jgi:hypothetical protein
MNVPCNLCGKATEYPFDLPGGKLACEKCYYTQGCTDCDDSVPLQDDEDINVCRTCKRSDCVSFHGADCPEEERLWAEEQAKEEKAKGVIDAEFTVKEHDTAPGYTGPDQFGGKDEIDEKYTQEKPKEDFDIPF